MLNVEDLKVPFHSGGTQSSLFPGSIEDGLTPKLTSICLGFRKSTYLSSPCAGPKGLRAESARAVTCRQFPHSGEGEDFLTGQLNLFTKTAVTPEQKVEKSIPRWEINRHAEG